MEELNAFDGDKLLFFFQMVDSDDVDVAQLCAQNIVLWQIFLEAFTRQEAIHQHLARVHHQLRVIKLIKFLE